MTRPTATAIEGSCVWTGAALADDPRWRFALSADDIAELDAALAAVRQRGLPWREMVRADFPLDRLAAKLAALAEELEDGAGLALLSGLPVDRYGDGLRHLWYGIGLHLGTPVYQDCDGLLMRDIRDEDQDTDALLGHQLTARDGGTFQSSKARTLSNGQLRFHTDRCDVVALLCLRQAAAGGISRVASSVTVHNAMLARHPELAGLLYQPIHRSRLGEERGGEKLHYPLPVFGRRDGRFTSHYSRTYVEAAQEMPGVPRMSDEQWRGLDCLHDLADEACLEFRLRPGDMQFVNNHVIYHARTAYRDAAEAGGRLLHRLWLSMPNSRALPPDQAVLWGNVGAGQLRGGIGQD